jgi:dienelactone hydrolase/predicted choloylglycine hydrolase
VSLLLLSTPVRAEIVAREGQSCLEKVKEQYVLHLKGTYREMGFAHGKLLAQATAEDGEAFLDHWCVGGGKEKLENLRKIYQTFEPFLPERYKEELAGLAEGSGVPLEKLQLLHAIPERFHCSGAAAMGAATKDGKLYHTRSLDYALNIGNKKRAQENALLIVWEPPDGNAYAVLGWAGFLGCVSGMNAKGISIGEMGSSCKDENYAGIPMVFLLREALRQGGTLEEALNVFRKGPRTCGYNFIVSDGKIPDARAIEVTRNHMQEFGPGDKAENVGPHYCLPCCVRRVNHFVGEETAKTQRNGYDPREANPASWVGYDLIGHWLKQNHGQIDGPRMIQLLRMYPPGHPCLHQAVFCPTDLDIWVSHAADPRKVPEAGAQNQPFYRYNLKRLLAAEPAEKALAIDYKDKPRAAEAPVVKGKVAFKPVGDETRNPERYRLDAHEFPFEMQLKHDYEGLGLDVFDVRFPSPVETPYPVNNTVHAEFYRPKGKGPFPGVIVLDILGPNDNLSVTRLQSTILAQNKIACLFVRMAYYGPRRPNDKPVRMISPNLNQTLDAIRQTVLDVRRAGAWLAAQSEIDQDKLGIMGTSLGSFIGSLAAEMEPRFKRVVVLLGGGGLVDAFYDLPQAGPLRTAFEVMGGSKEKLAKLIACVDPITCAENLKDRKVLMLAAKRDDIVPPKATEALWVAVGKPKIVWYDCTHVGAALFLVPAMQEVVTHFTAP